jgi:hypothetical protein
MEDRCSVAVNSMAADYQAAAAGSTARRSSTIPINMILWKGRLLGHTEHHQPKPLAIHGQICVYFPSDFTAARKSRESPLSFLQVSKWTFREHPLSAANGTFESCRGGLTA